MEEQAGKQDPNSRQMGGDHYRKVNPHYQHWDLVNEYWLDYYLGCATKYVSRWRDKDGVMGLDKAMHFLDKLIDIYDQNPRRWALRQPAVPGHTLYEFCRAHNLSRNETLFIEMAVNYCSRNDLDRMKILLEAIIREAPANQVSQHLASLPA